MSKAHTEPAAGLLVATLIAALLAASAAVLIQTARTERAAATETVRFERARLAAESAASAAIVRLDAADQTLRLDGRPSPLSSGSPGADARLTLQDANGLVDLNTGSTEELASLLAALGLPASDASVYARRIAEARTPPTGEANIAAKPGLDAARLARFQTEADLARVEGLPAAVVACLAPFVTVFSVTHAVDPAVAPARLRELLGLPTYRGGGALLGPPLGHVVIVTAEAPVSAQTHLRLTEWVRLTGDADTPVMVHRARTDLAPSTALSDQTGCRPGGERAP